MKSFIVQLISRYQSILENASLSADEQEEMRGRLNSLRLAEAVIEKLDATRTHPGHPLQVGIVGPTQAGKSTLINLLLNSDHAGVSALAGYTVHAQGFSTGATTDNVALDQVLEQMFPGYERVQQPQLDAGNYRQYSLSDHGHTDSQEGGQQSFNPSNQPMVVWDSPDFDSIESRGYRTAVLRVAALADVLIFVMSKDKYADRSVWDMMGLLAPLCKPTLHVINKLNPEDLQTVSDSFRQRYKENIDAKAQDKTSELAPDIVTLPYIRGLADNADMLQQAGAEELFQHLGSAIDKCSRDTYQCDTARLIETHWQSWLEPVRREHRAHDEWNTRVDNEIAQAFLSYKESYIDEPQKYDTFNRAIAELLSLLEVPGLAGTLTTTRNVVTWPVRKIFGLGRDLASDVGLGGVFPGTGNKDQDHETETLIRVHSKVMSDLQNLTMDNGDSENAAWWLELNRTLRSSEQSLSDTCVGKIETYQKDFEPEIEQAAQSLYKTLENQPAVLNSLRAARVTTDAAAVVLAVKSGGLAASDLLIAPAMLSLTSMLTEGAVGKYMNTVKQQLKEKQLENVEQLLKQQLAPELKALASNVAGSSVFGIGPEEIDRATRELSAFSSSSAIPATAPGAST